MRNGGRSMGNVEGRASDGDHESSGSGIGWKDCAARDYQSVIIIPP